MAESLRVAHKSRALRTKDLARVTVDTAVQPNRGNLTDTHVVQNYFYPYPMSRYSSIINLAITGWQEMTNRDSQAHVRDEGFAPKAPRTSVPTLPENRTKGLKAIAEVS